MKSIIKVGLDVSIDIFNPAGDKAEACGNGTRCVAKILFDQNNEKETLKILSDAGILIYFKMLKEENLLFKSVQSKIN